MKRELTTVEWTCDRCKYRTVVTEFNPTLPKGWAYHHITDCGMTGYSRSIEICSTCVKKDGNAILDKDLNR